MQNEEVKLKPCPFCGGEARLQVTERGVAVVCKRLSECGCRTDYYIDFNVVVGQDDWKQRRTAVEKAVEVWNRRTKDVEPVKYGRWMSIYEDPDTLYCSECRRLCFQRFASNYCSHCGAKMVPESPKEEDDED